MRNNLSLWAFLALLFYACAGSTMEEKTEKIGVIEEIVAVEEAPIVEEAKAIGERVEEERKAEEKKFERQFETKPEGFKDNQNDLVTEKEVIQPVDSVEEEDVNVLLKAFDALLKKYVTEDGNVNYKGLTGEKEKLDGFITSFSKLNIESASRNEQLAFWINLYNACTLQLVCNHYPIKSIMDINSGKPWDLQVVEIAGKGLSLNQIENDIIRPDFNEPRIHFAVNCAAKSCPKLLNKAFFPNSLDAELTVATQVFLSNANQNQFEEDRAKVSKIFEWYAADFGNLIQFLNRYSPHVLSETGEVSFNEYDWSLNE